MMRIKRMKRTALVIAVAAATVWMSGCAMDDETDSSQPQAPDVETITADTSADTVSTDTSDTETVTDTMTQTAETSADTTGSDQAGNADKETQKDTVWITVDDSYVTDAGSWTAKDFENAERFTVKADGTWSCEATEGDMFGGATGTWSKSAGDKILMDYPEGGTANKGCSIQFTDPDKGEAELLTNEGKCLLIRNDTECGTIADQLFGQMLKDSGQ